MSEQEYQQFERELKRFKPAAPPPELLAQLAAACAPKPTRAAPGLAEFLRSWAGFPRFLVPATALLLSCLLWLCLPLHSRPGRSEPEPASPVKADEVQFGEELVHSFDTVAQLPTGEPVRFRCREWQDELVVRDKSRGVVIQQRTPRVEVVPVRFETY